MDRMARNLLLYQVISNPLPWRVERGWSYEVTASNGVIVAKCRTYADAEEIIIAAQSIRQELDGVKSDPGHILSA